jgi:hypothetical protein
MISERLFEDVLVKYPELIEGNLRLIGRQVNYFGKRIDILFEDRFKEKLIVELKKDNLDRNALSQVMEYEGYILSEKDPSARVMLIANRIPLNLKKAMDHHGIEYKEITNKQIFEFLEKNDPQLLELITSQQPKQKEDLIVKERGTYSGNLINNASLNRIIGTVNNVKAKKDSKDRFEIWISRSSESSFPYGLTSNSEGITVKIKINEKIYSIGFHNTKSNIWLSARLDRDQYNLTDLLKSQGIENRGKLLLTPLGEETYQITKLKTSVGIGNIVNNVSVLIHSRRGRIIDMINLNMPDQEILKVLENEFPPGTFKTSNKQALAGTKWDIGK